MKTEVPADMPLSEFEGEAAERRSYIVGFVLAFLLTGAAFALVWTQVVAGLAALAVLGMLALAQILVHFRCFLHIDLARSHRDDLKLILFTVLIVGMIIGGTIWILYDQHTRMMV